MRTKLICALLALCLFCSGCSVIDFDTQNLMSPPKATGDKADIQKVIEENAGNYTLKYPQNGEYRSAVVMHDINGDGSNEAIAFYNSSSSENTADITVAFIDKVNGTWQQVAAFQNSAAEVERICFADLNGDGSDAVLIGWSNYASTNQATVFRYAEGEILPYDLDYAYTDLVFMDFDRDGVEELFLSSVNTADRAAAARLLKYSSASDSLVNVGEVEMDPEVTQYLAFQAGELENGYRGVFIDGIKSGSQVTTELVYWDPKEQILRSPFYSSSGTAQHSFSRSTNTVCYDIDDDGLLEIPVTEPMPGMSSSMPAGNSGTTYRTEVSQSSVPAYRTLWQRYSPDSQELTTVETTYVNTEDDYYFVMPSSWMDSITGRYDSEQHSFIFSQWVVNAQGTGAAGAAVLEIQVFSRSDWNANITSARDFIKIREKDGKVYAINIPDAGGDYQISYSDAAKRLKLFEYDHSDQ